MKNNTNAARIDEIFANSIAAISDARAAISEQVSLAANELAAALKAGNKILICGNGGSASDSLHFSSELVNKFERARRPLPAISLVADPATLTSIANDENYDMVFAKQIQAFAKSGDILVLITSSGNSDNLVKAVDAAHAAGIKCIALNGKGGGKISNKLVACDINIIVPSDSTARVQEIHAIIIHIFCEFIDQQI